MDKLADLERAVAAGGWCSRSTVSAGQAAVERVGSARRIWKDGRILVRYSSTAKAPERRSRRATLIAISGQ